MPWPPPEPRERGAGTGRDELAKTGAAMSGDGLSPTSSEATAISTALATASALAPGRRRGLALTFSARRPEGCG
ncbi:hypothetical protein [Paracoccus methylarcula]|uniref:hypothetical protein n=1 Tax=Paracoccus methylarcula TaxID=72022 RepID=UPI001FEAEA78|nr:hypothetical protein [Paracoccus methylarcula]